MTEELQDIGGHDLGRPAAVITVRSKDDLREAMARGRAESRPVVPVGLRASYWHNLRLDGAIALDMTGFDRVLATETEDGYVTVESGIAVRRLDQYLRAHGCHLPMHPDAYGDTPVGASFANGTTAGVGMLWGCFEDQVLGLELMLGDGSLVQVGASRTIRGARGPIGQGVPDLRSLLFGAEGAVGIITEMDVALIPSPWAARLVWQDVGDDFAHVLRAGLHWRRRGCVETLRWVWSGSGSLAATVVSRVSEAELEGRVQAVQRSMAGWPAPRVEYGSPAERRGEMPDYERYWPGPPGSTWKRAGATPFAGIDAFVPYARAGECYAWARAISLGVPHQLRVAAYLGRDGVNVGVHVVFAEEASRATGRAQLEGLLGELAGFDAVPYRPGIVWSSRLRTGWDERTLRALDAIAHSLDPDGRVPGAGMLRGVAPDGKARP